MAIITPDQWNTTLDPGTNEVLIGAGLYTFQNAVKPWSLGGSALGKARFEVRPGDQWSGDSAFFERSELTSETIYSPGNQVSIVYDFTVEAGTAAKRQWAACGQARQLEHNGYQAPLAIFLAGGDKMWIQVNYVAANGHQAQKTIYQDGSAITRGTTYRMEVYATFDQGLGTASLLVRRNGTDLVSYQGKMGFPGMAGVRWHMGICRNASDQNLAVNYANLTIGNVIAQPSPPLSPPPPPPPPSPPPPPPAPVPDATVAADFSAFSSQLSTVAADASAVAQALAGLSTDTATFQGDLAALQAKMVAAGQLQGQGPLNAAYTGLTLASLNTYESWLGKTLDAVPIYGGFQNPSGAVADFTASLRYLFNTGNIANQYSTDHWLVSLPMCCNPATNGSYGDESLSTLNAGEYDALWLQNAQYLSQHIQGPGPIDIRLGWEFNGNWYPWKCTAATATLYAAVWERMRGISAIDPRFRFWYSPAAGNQGAPWQFDWTLAYPSDDSHVYGISFDRYYQPLSDGGFDNNDPTTAFNNAASAQYIGMDAIASFAKAKGKALAVNEWGVSVDAPVWVNLMISWMSKNAVQYQGYGEAFTDGHWQLSTGTKPQSAAAFLGAYGFH